MLQNEVMRAQQDESCHPVSRNENVDVCFANSDLYSESSQPSWPLNSCYSAITSCPHEQPQDQGVKCWLPQCKFPFHSQAHFSSLYALTASPALLTLSVVSVEGRLEMQRLCYLKRCTRREGQTVGRFTMQPNTTAGDEHPKQPERETIMWCGKWAEPFVS